jgi:pyruvate dehydrogenase E2 component (dihydrolipoamide acetyltransferase)
MRQIIADRLSLSKSTIPHFYLFQDLDMEDALVWRELFNQRTGTKITVTDMIVWAVAATLREFPRINAHVEQDRLVAKARICVGVATATEDGLLVPAVPDTDGLEIQDLSAEIRRRSQEARNGKLDLTVKGTFTVTSLGMFGTQSFLPIINPPEAAILAVGAAENRPVAVGNLVGIRKVMTVTLACDHRAVNGAEAAQFLARLKQIFADRFVPAR